MNSRTRTATQLSKFLVLALFFLALAPAALASNIWYVDGVNGNDNNDCKTAQTACQTIGHAISLCSSGDTIRVAPAIYIENLTIGISLKILGSDAKTTIVDGNQAGAVFTISKFAHVLLSKLTIRNGSAWQGGGIENSARLTINNSTISGNSSSYKAGGILNGRDSTLNINNSTISGNNAGTVGGGIFNDERGGMIAINNSTISGNSGPIGGRGLGSFSPNPIILQNTIVANNPSGGNCYTYGGAIITSDGYNLSSDNTCPFNGPGDMNNTDPKLGQLGNYGGPTQTIPLLKRSPAIDAGNPNGCTDSKGNLLKTDQRSYPRPGKYDSSGRCDIGAFERQKD